MTDRTPFTGSCMCGAVRFRVDGPLTPVLACHCRECRRQTTHLLATSDARKEQMTLEGEDALRWYRSGAHTRRGFCGTCGSVLFFDEDGRDTIGIGAGAIDDTRDLRLTRHVWVKEKGSYYAIDDCARQYETSAD